MLLWSKTLVFPGTICEGASRSWRRRQLPACLFFFPEKLGVDSLVLGDEFVVYSPVSDEENDGNAF